MTAARDSGLGRALGGEAPEFDCASLLVLLGRLQAKSAQDGGEVGGGAAELGGEFGRHGEGGCLRAAADLRELRDDAIGKIGAHGAGADAEIACGPQHGLGPRIVRQRERRLRGRRPDGLVCVDGAQGEGEAGGGGLQEAGEPCRDAAGLDAGGVEGGAVVVGEWRGLACGGGGAAVERGAGFEQLVGDAAGSAAQGCTVEHLAEIVQGAQLGSRMVGEPAGETLVSRFAAGGGGVARAEEFDGGRMPVGGGNESCNACAFVNDHGLVGVEGEIGVWRLRDGREAALDDRAQGFEGCTAQGASGEGFACSFGGEDKAFEAADIVAADQDFAGRADLGGGVLFGVERLQQRRCAAIDEAEHQRLVEGVRELVLDLARAAAPCLGVLEPVAAVGGVGPGADGGEALLENVDLAFGAVEGFDVGVHPLVLDAGGGLAEFLDEGLHELDVRVGTVLAEVRQGAEIPQAADMGVGARGFHDVLVLRQHGERHLVERFGRAAEDHVGRGPAEGGEEVRNARPVEIGVAPVEIIDRLEMVIDDAVDGFFLEGRAVGCLAERAVVAEAAGAAGDLGKFVGAKIAALAAIEFAARGEGDVADIEVEAHADCVSGDDVVDFAGLVEVDLRIAGARRERAHDDGAAATLALQQFGDGVDFFRTERDDG